MKLKGAAFSLVMFASSTSIYGQEVNLNALQENISIFSNIIEESLELDQATGIFGNRVGGVEGIYLHGQGVVLEIRTPLANKRNQVGFTAIGRTMRWMNRSNPFAEISAQNSASALSATAENSDVSKSVIDRLASVDYSLAVNTALQQATSAVRSLRSTGSVDDEGYAQLQQELDLLRVESQEKMAQLREMVASSLEESENETSKSTFDFQAEFDAFLAKVEPLKEQALAKAAELQARSEQAQKEYALQLEKDIREFEAKLFATLCTYGASLPELPESENISVILEDLGDEGERARLANKVHVLKKTDILKCQSGEIDALTLLAQSVTYSY